VFSKTLKSANWPKSRIVRGDLGEEIVRLKSLPGKDIVLGGGPRLAQSFLERELADELYIEMFPSIVGRGKPLFCVAGNPDHSEDVVPQGAPGRHDFTLIEARPAGRWDSSPSLCPGQFVEVCMRRLDPAASFDDLDHILEKMRKTHHPPLQLGGSNTMALSEVSGSSPAGIACRPCPHRRAPSRCVMIRD
jgi:hypothetical protein